MRGIVLLNPNYRFGDLHTNESFTIQKIMTDKYRDEMNISPVILNPYQIHPYYTIPHELLFNLQKRKTDQIDCLILHSIETIERFIYIYPEKWLELCGYFKEIISVATLTPVRKSEAN
ncbi:hypothetical protein ACDZ29_16130 [Peribacillus sp. RS7]|jgi:predicted aldo/keto reductase-like oxidoreductase|nr:MULTISPECIES: hypothetical protein [unclassified Peribacillus]MDM5213905.1 hypothetical protein [Peribacillus sp. NJ4]MDM5224280.1 hypothetical protein [Peribacillus sp. NJ11]MDM5357496.1 hypothetical protein [Peribacillus sp. ACCC06369]